MHDVYPVLISCFDGINHNHTVKSPKEKEASRRWTGETQIPSNIMIPAARKLAMITPRGLTAASQRRPIVY